MKDHVLDPDSKLSEFAAQRNDSGHPQPRAAIRWVMGGQFVELIDDAVYDAQDFNIRPGFVTPLHRHTRYAEHLYVVVGSVDIQIDNERHVLTAGESATIPTGTPHALAAGERGASGLILSRPAGFANVIRSSGAATKDRFDLDQCVSAAMAAGDEILGPPPAAAES
jgi:quercetin dioxygenase-like cupin family protein